MRIISLQLIALLSTLLSLQTLRKKITKKKKKTFQPVTMDIVCWSISTFNYTYHIWASLGNYT